MLTRLHLHTAGESHGPQLTAILDGVPAGLPVDVGAIDAMLARRQRGHGASARMRIERDRVRITGGVLAGHTTGAPLALHVDNRDHASWRDRDVAAMTRPRPGHADLTGAIKYGHPDLRHSLERASARETAARVAAGAVCVQLLTALGVEIGGYVVQIGGVVAEPAPGYPERIAGARDSDLSCPDVEAAGRMRAAIDAARSAKDTLGGVIEVVALGLPPGLGSYAQWDQRLEARIGAAMLGIQAIKGVEVGPAFANAGQRGTEVHDAIARGEDGALLRPTNRAGGIEGGISTGAPLVVRLAKKPISTTLTPQDTVDLATGAPARTAYERSDICAVPRAVPIAEAVLALVLADAMLCKLGGDSLDELRPRLASLRRAHLDDLRLSGERWRLGYPE